MGCLVWTVRLTMFVVLLLLGLSYLWPDPERVYAFQVFLSIILMTAAFRSLRSTVTDFPQPGSRSSMP